MKIFGFCDNENTPKLLDQVTLEVDESELRQMVQFFSRCAEELESDEGWDHEHLSDYLGRILEQDLVIYSSTKSDRGLE